MIIRTKIVAHGPGRLQLQEIHLQEEGKDSVALVWYYRDRDKFNQLFHVTPTERGCEMGLMAFDTEDPYKETIARLPQLHEQLGFGKPTPPAASK